MNRSYGIIQYPELILQEECVPIDDFESSVFLRIAKPLVFEAKRMGRVGVAAPQLGFNMRMFAAQFDEPDPVLFVNPVIKHREGTQIVAEGCLSLWGRWFELERSFRVIGEAQNIDGKTFPFDATGKEAQIIQHEIDHLLGFLVKDRVEYQLAGMHRPQRRRMQKELDRIK
jgi:peptide deformylase